jgi:hypothetical protein
MNEEIKPGVGFCSGRRDTGSRQPRTFTGLGRVFARRKNGVEAITSPPPPEFGMVRARPNRVRAIPRNRAIASRHHSSSGGTDSETFAKYARSRKMGFVK